MAQKNTCTCSPIYPDENGHIKRRIGQEEILGSKGQFCAAFYHVHKCITTMKDVQESIFVLTITIALSVKEQKKRIASIYTPETWLLSLNSKIPQEFYMKQDTPTAHRKENMPKISLNKTLKS